MTNLDSILKSKDITLPTKVNIVKAMVFPVVIYGYESWTIKKSALKNWCIQTVMPEKTLESPLNSKSTPVSPKGNSPWIFIEGLMLKLKLQYFGHLKSQLFGKDPVAGKGWGQKEKEVTKDEMVGWHHELNWFESEQTPGDMKDREAWHASVHGVAKSLTWLSNWTTAMLAGSPFPHCHY